MSAYTKKKPMKIVLLIEPVLAKKKGKLSPSKKPRRIEKDSSKPDDAKL